ncbi:MAG: polysaccharide deacetylase family protein [Clostridia bacterium]|nr:polysaccharide deacetylase family protein [Clostridia bacterium]
MMKLFLKRAALWCMILCFLPLTAYGAVSIQEASVREGVQPTPYPEDLQISIVYEEWAHENGLSYEVAVPVTCREDVNHQLRQAQQALFEEAVSHANVDSVVELRATYRISGQSWAGFLLTGRVLELVKVPGTGYKTENGLFLCQNLLTFDMATGASLTLADVFPEGSEAWEQLRQTVGNEMADCYPQLSHNEEYMEQVKGDLASLPFMPCAGRLVLSLPMWRIVPEKPQLCNISLMYPDYRQWMTEDAQLQTDNSHRPMVCLTYDDGPDRVQTHTLLRNLDTYGASATFFVLGKSISRFPELGRRELDRLHTVGSHTFEHKYEYQMTVSQLRQDRETCKATHLEYLGVEPVLFRAPGGSYKRYVENEVGWPVILWNNSCGDTGDNNMNQLARHVITIADDGDFILLHDIKEKTVKGTALFLEALTQEGFLFATVDEVLYLHGIVPQPNQAYYSVFSDAASQSE